MHLRVLVGACALLLSSHVAVAQDPVGFPRTGTDADETEPPIRPLDQTSMFWREIRQPGIGRVRRLVDEGSELLTEAAASEGIAPSPMARMRRRSAVVRFERALDILPTDPEALFFLGRGLASLGTSMSTAPDFEERGREAVTAFVRLRRLWPTYRAEEVGFALGVLYSGQNEYAAAIEAYETSLRFSMSEAQTPVTYSNLAEVRMMSGDLTGAVADYERGIAIGRMHAADPQTLGLPLFGLAVALDRLGETEESARRATQAVMTAGNSLDHLTSQGVFFDPESEIHYYMALGYQALSELYEGELQRVHLRMAVENWRSYLRLATADDRWQDLVAERLLAAEARLQSHERSRPQSR